MINWGKFSPKALDVLRNSTARLVILDGAIRSSKTVTLSVRWIEYCLIGPPGDLFMCGKTLATLRRNVLNDLFDIVGKSNFHWTDRQQGELTLLGRRVFCFGATNEEAESKLRGATIAGALCDEVNLYPESFFAQLLGRMSVQGAQCFCSCNPDNPYHWFYTNYILNDAIDSKQRWHFMMDDNYNLSEEYKNALKQMYYGIFYRRFILGEWCIAEGAIYDMFDRNTHVKDRSKEKPIQYIISCDYGTSTVMSWSLIGYYLDGTYHKIDEYYYDAVKFRLQKTDSQFGNEFERFVKQVPQHMIEPIICDPSAASWKAELRSRGFIVRDADNDVINGIRTVGSLLAAGKYTISPVCLNTISEYPSYAWDSTAQRMGIDKPIKINDHACDSDRYALYTTIGNSTSGVYSRRVV